MKMYLMLPEYLWNSSKEQYLYGMVETIFRKEEILSSHKHQQEGEIKLFDLFVECKGLIVMPYYAGTLDKDQLYAGRVFEALKKPIYLMNFNGLTICESFPVKQLQLQGG